MLVFEKGWDQGENNNAPKALAEDELRKKILEALGKLPKVTKDKELLYLYGHATSDSPLAKAKVIKGMHQDTGNAILAETHCTVQIPDYPFPKTYHIWFIYLKTGWWASQVSHQTGPQAFTHASL
jgi:hypothetical protein